MLPRPPYTPLQTPAPYSQTPSAYILPAMLETNFDTDTKAVKIMVLYILIYMFFDKEMEKEKYSAPNESKFLEFILPLVST